MRFLGMRRLALAAVPVAVAASVFGFTAAPASAIDCDPANSSATLAAIQQAEQTADDYVYGEELALDNGDYDLANYEYIMAGKWFAYADSLKATLPC
jgi:hypothetical protein